MRSEAGIRRGRLLLASVVAAVASALACSLSGTDGLSGGGADAAAAEASSLGDAAPPSSGDGGSEDAGPRNLLGNGDFELGCSGGWASNDAFLTSAESTAAHGGTRSCRVCSREFDAGASLLFFSFYGQEVPGHAPVVGAPYDGEVWIRNAPDALPGGEPFETVVATLQLVGEDAGVLDEVTSAATVPANDWSRIAVTRAFTPKGSKLRFSVVLQRHTDNTGCILIDDARLVVAR